MSGHADIPPAKDDGKNLPEANRDLHPSLADRRQSAAFNGPGTHKASGRNEDGLSHIDVPALPFTAISVSDFHLRTTSGAQLSQGKNGDIEVTFPSGSADGGGAVLTHKISGPLPDGQGVDVRAWVRSDKPSSVGVELIQPKEPYAATISEPIDTSSKWQQLRLHGITPDSADGLSMNLKVNSGGGRIEFKDVEVVPAQALRTEPSHSTIKYGQVEENKNQDAIVTDANGKHTEMRNGKPFVVGFEVQSLHPAEQSQGQDGIQSLLKDYANGATVTPYWDQWQKAQQPTRDKIGWLLKNDVANVKDHPALWGGGNVPADLPADWKQAQPLIKAHAQEIARLPGKFTEINEVADFASQSPNGVTNWERHEGAAKATEEAIDWIRQADPNKTIIYNDYQNGALETKMLDQLQKDGKLPDAIGIQLHMDQGEWPLSRVEETVNQLAKYGKPIYITEISVLSGEHGRSLSTVNRDEMQQMSAQFEQLAEKAKGTQSPSMDAMAKLAADAKSLTDPGGAENDVAILKLMEKTAAQLQDNSLKDAALAQITKSETWASTPEGEQRQADYTENLYKLLHNNPHVQGITWWDMSDKDSWKLAPRGWFRADGTPKPVVDRMKRLFDEWMAQAPQK